jgi:hypothetical protein
MTIREQLVQELAQTPDVLMPEVLNFLHHLQQKYSQTTARNTATALVALQNLSAIGRRQPAIDAVKLSRASRDDLQNRGGV